LSDPRDSARNLLVPRTARRRGARARAPAAEHFELARHAKSLKRLRRPLAASIQIDALMSANQHGRRLLMTPAMKSAESTRAAKQPPEEAFFRATFELRRRSPRARISPTGTIWPSRI